MAHSTTNTDHIIEAEVISKDLQDYFEEKLMAKNYVEMIEFSHGDELLIPSVGQGEVRDYKEDQAIKYSQLDTGEFRFKITEYVQSGYSITDKLRQDSFMGDRLVSLFEPRMRRALEERIERDIWNTVVEQQTQGDLNLINEGQHRFIGSGTNNVISVEDFAYANFVFDKANVPTQGRMVVVDPSVEYQLSTLMNLVTLDNNPKWEGVVRDGMSDDCRFMMNVYGFDVYVSNFLPRGLTETIAGNTVENAVANIWMASAPDKRPLIGSMRQEPRVESERNKDYQRDEFALTARYGFDLYHPESVIVTLTDAAQVRP